MDRATYQILKFKELPKEYQAVVESTFLRSLRRGNDYFHLIDPATYFDVYRSYFRMLLKRPVIIRLAVLSDDHDVLIGWSVTAPDVLHYVYVSNFDSFSDSVRRQGIGSDLVPEPFREFTHITKLGLIIWKKKYPDAIFNPFA